jgi:hypothetical protein
MVTIARVILVPGTVIKFTFTACWIRLYPNLNLKLRFLLYTLHKVQRKNPKIHHNKKKSLKCRIDHFISVVNLLLRLRFDIRCIYNIYITLVSLRDECTYFPTKITHFSATNIVEGAGNSVPHPQEGGVGNNNKSHIYYITIYTKTK